jgi:hypothetical protein
VKQIELDKLQQRLESFGKALTSVQCEEFRQILFSIGILHNSVGDIYKYAELALIPSKTDAANFAYKQGECLCAGFPGKNVICPYCGCTEALPQSTTFKPPAKQSLADLTMTLARNLELNLKK